MSPLASWTVIAVGSALVWLIVAYVNERAARRNAERALGAAMLEHVNKVHVLSRSGLRKRTLNLDDMTPEQFRQALEEIEREETL